MILFWAIGAGLIALALFFVLRPLLARGASAQQEREASVLAIYRDQLRELDEDLRAGTLDSAHYEKARRELEARLLEDLPEGEPRAPARRAGRAAALAAGLAVPVCALAIYLAVGNPQALAPQTEAPHGVTREQFERLVERLALRMEKSPEDAEGWIMLGRSYSVLGRFPEAARAYANAAARRPGDAQVLADYADALAMAQGSRLAGEPERIVARALELDPKNLKALALAGTAAFEKKDFAGAERYWERMLPLVPEGSEAQRTIRENIAEARALAGAPPAAVGGEKRLSGIVKLAPALAAKVAPDDTVFIFARALEGPRAPLAVLRKRVRDLPAEFALDDTMAMAPDLKLSDHARVVVGARVSKRASVTAQPGDLEGFSAPVPNDAAGVTVLIDTEVR